MARERDEPAIARRMMAEAFGTFALVFVAAGGDAFARVAPGQIDAAARAVAPALIVAAMISAIGDVSGAHLNPVVSAAFAAKGQFPWRRIPLYWLAQLGGALAAAMILALLVGTAIEAAVSTPHVPDGVALAIEAILTMLLVSVILGTADRARVVGPSAAFAVAGTIAMAGLIALPIEGASMNPARSLGPALVAGRVGDLWIYVGGPFVGGLLAVIATRFLHGAAARDPEALEAAQGDETPTGSSGKVDRPAAPPKAAR